MKNEPSEIGGGKDLRFLRPQMVTLPTTGQSCIAGIFFYTVWQTREDSLVYIVKHV